MNTEALIDALARDAVPEAAWRRRMRWLVIVAGCAISIVGFVLQLGVRSDVVVAMATWRFDLKLAVVLAVAIAAVVQCARALSPIPARGLHWTAYAALALVAGALAAEMAMVPRSDWVARARGSNAIRCLTVLPLLALPPLAGLLAVARRAAPASTQQAGLALGAVAWSLGAVLYAFHCFDDSPLFVVTWYGLALIGLTALGGVVGRYILKW